MTKQIERTQNILTLVGNLGADPVTRTTPTGKTVVEFRMAAGEGEERRWYSVQAWGKLGETYAVSLQKGDFVKVRGSYHEEHWTDNEGQARITHKVTARFVGHLKTKTPELTIGHELIEWLRAELAS